MDLNDLKMDKKKETEGAWFEVDKDTKLLIARANNKKYLECFRKLQKPYLSKIRRGTIDNAKYEQWQREAHANCILLGWEGLKENGVPLEYSVAKAIEIFEEIPDFLDTVMLLSQDMASYKAEMAADT